MTARTDPETVRAHVNRINRWQTASEHQYPGPYRAFLHEWCRYPSYDYGKDEERPSHNTVVIL